MLFPKYDVLQALLKTIYFVIPSPLPSEVNPQHRDSSIHTLCRKDHQRGGEHGKAEVVLIQHETARIILRRMKYRLPFFRVQKKESIHSKNTGKRSVYNTLLPPPKKRELREEEPSFCYFFINLTSEYFFPPSSPFFCHCSFLLPKF